MLAATCIEGTPFLTKGAGVAVVVRSGSNSPGLPMNPDIDDFAARLREFARERDWEQFHAPKNLASALVVEAGELLEHFQWMPEEQSRQLGPEKKQAVEEEVADVFLYLVRFADVLDIDIAQAALRKLERNAARYPVALARGSSRKAGEPGS